MKDYTLFHFWSSQSASTINDFTKLLSLIKQYDRKFTAYNFPYATKPQIPAVRQMTLKYKLNWSHLLQYKQSDRQGAAVINLLQINIFPTNMLLDQDGMILVRFNFLKDIEVVLVRLE